MKSLIVFSFVLTSNLALSQGKKCDIDVLSRTHASINKLTPNDIRIFLSVFDSSCSSNVEFSEFSNELLFNVLDKYTKEVLLILEKGYSGIQLRSVLSELESPLTDAIDLNNLIQKVEKVKASQQIKKQVIDALQVSNNQ